MEHALSSTVPAGARPVVARGVERALDPRVWGSAIGAAGGCVFVLANRGSLAAPVSALALVACAAALAFYVWRVWWRRRPFPEPEPVGRWAGLVYLASVAGMLVLIRLGRLALGDNHEDLVPGVIVLAVGLHFLPFARAFHTPLFRRLGLVMAALGVAALVLGLVWTPVATAGVVVLTGLAMLVLIGLAAG
ncbi:hypothetical protein ACFT5B_04020 [Luteimicrobium sp. NPDC057192]|uniref:hypothetical protein n=1 Tax=Luteimicrobium sp. NPDC057192 TaxID=3346042 RepID=UPI00362E25AE